MATLGLCCSRKLETNKQPNFVVIFLDDSGWADFKPFGHPDYPTPHVNRLAQQGCRFNNFYVPQAVCSASRASLLTGCYPGHTKVFGALGPRARGLDPEFATIGELLKAQGYTTGVFGKWHLGDQPETRPLERGFDEACGLMYSNDMRRFHPQSGEYFGQWPLQYWENNKITIDPVLPENQPMLTTWYTEHSLCFLAGASLPDYEIDGRNVWDLIAGKPGAKNPHQCYAFSTNNRFESVISGDGRWKLHLPHQYATLVKAGRDGMPGEYTLNQIELSLFDMRNDPYERYNVIEQYPQRAAELQRFAQQHKKRYYEDDSKPGL